jgi:Glycerophosphoryl diester phosphodiesterase family
MTTSEGGKVFREWTPKSVEKALGLGVQMLVLNVQVTRDQVPVVFSAPYIMGTAIHSLALHQLQTFRIHREGEVSPDHQVFIKLEDLLRDIDSGVDFLIQLSGPVANDFVDSVLEVVLKGASQRRILFSSPLPTLCTLLQYKQNLYPVTLLLNRNTEPEAVEGWATAVQLLGYNVQDKVAFERIAPSELVAFCCWKERHNPSIANMVALDRKVNYVPDADADGIWTLVAEEGVEVVAEEDEEEEEAGEEETVESDFNRCVHITLPQATLSTATSCESFANLGLL